MAGGLLAGVMASTAFAATTPTLTTTVSTTTPEQGLSVSLTFSGTAADGVDSTIYAVTRPAGGVACQASFAADQAASPASHVIANGTADVAASSAYSVPASWTPDASGSQIVCAWLEQPVAGSTPTVSAGPVSTAVTVRGPQATLAVAFPSAPVAKQPFQIQYTTQTDQPLSLHSLIRKAADGPCDASAGADQAQFPNSTQVLAGTSVSSGPMVTTGRATLGPGSYLVCTWVQGPTGGEVDAAASTAFVIATPPPPPKPAPAPKADPAIAITSLSASASRGIRVAGTTAPTLVGTLTLNATCGTTSVSGTASASAGHFGAALALPTGCIALSQVTLKVHYAGSKTFAKAVASNSTVVAATPVSHHTTTRRTLFTEARRGRQSITNVFRTRPDRILVASSPRLVLRLHWTRWTTRGGRGHGTAFTRQHHHYRIDVTAGHAFDGTFACLTITHRVRGRREIRRLGLAREGRSLRWVGLTTLHSRHFTGKPWPLDHGCPAVRTTGS
jgi:hypothetical protein